MMPNQSQGGIQDNKQVEVNLNWSRKQSYARPLHKLFGVWYKDLSGYTFYCDLTNNFETYHQLME